MSLSTKIIVALMLFSCGFTQADLKPSSITKVVMLGTGTPFADPDRSGPSVAIVVNDVPYIVDFGPGVVRRASAMSPEYCGSIKGLGVKHIKHAFLKAAKITVHPRFTQHFDGVRFSRNL